jgi:hypothetical protein
VPLAWRAKPALAAVTSYDLRFRTARWNGGFGSPVAWLGRTDGTRATFRASPGATYCFSVRARDADGGVSPWSRERCTAVPLDDRSLRRTLNWTARIGGDYFRATYLRTSTHGARLIRSGVVARRIALLATTCPACGTVDVYWGATLLRTISLRSATTTNRRLIAVRTFASARTGTLRIVVVSRGRTVIIDGVAIRRN